VLPGEQAIGAMLRKLAAPNEIWNRRVSAPEFGALLPEDKFFRDISGKRNIQAP